MRTYVVIIFTLVSVFGSIAHAQFLSPLPPALEDPDETDKSKLWPLFPSKMIFQSPDSITALYKDEGNFLTAFSSSIGKKRSYAISELLSGVGGPFRVSLSSAIVIARKDTTVLSVSDSVTTFGDTTSDTLSTTVTTTEARIDTLDDLNSAVTRLVVNGGTLSLKFLHPLWAGGGSVQRTAAVVYPQIGIGNSLSNIDEGKPIGVLGCVGEMMGSYTLRDLDGSGRVAFEIILGIRGGVHYLTRGIEGLESQKRYGFYQVAGGIRQKSKMSYSVIFTQVEGKARDFVSRWSINIATSL